MSENEECNLARQAALVYLKTKPRSRGEVLRYLANKSYSRQASEEAVARLEEQGLLDDARFLEAWLHYYGVAHPKGSYWIRHELQGKDIAPELIEEIVEPFIEANEEETAWALAEKKWQILPPSPQRPAKLARYLQAKGFPSGTISRVLHRLRM